MPSSESHGRASQCRHADTCRDVDTSSSSPSIRHHAATVATLLILAFLEVSHRRVVWHRRCIVPELRNAMAGRSIALNSYTTRRGRHEEESGSHGRDNRPLCHWDGGLRATTGDAYSVGEATLSARVHSRWRFG